jgi:endonuclease-3
MKVPPKPPHKSRGKSTTQEHASRGRQGAGAWTLRNESKKDPAWETIFRSLKAWRKDLQKAHAAGPAGSRNAAANGAPGGGPRGAARGGAPGGGPRNGNPGGVSPATGADPSVTTVAEIFNQDPWAVLVSTIISLRTKDEVTMISSRALLEKAPDPQELLALDENTIAALIYPAGFYRTKAANLKKIAVILIDRYDGKIPADMEQLLALPGVGRKTANLVLTEAFNKEGLCVDIHVHRISNRNGWVTTKTPEETEMRLRTVLPKKYWKPINPLLVLYGQNLCRPVSPYCSRCVISGQCQKKGVEKSR